MTKTVLLAILFCAPLLAQAADSPPSGNPTQQPGMVIKGDQEAPLVLYIVPWQEPKQPAPPEVPRQALIPAVLDDNKSLVDDPVNRSTVLRMSSPRGEDK